MTVVKADNRTLLSVVSVKSVDDKLYVSVCAKDDVLKLRKCSYIIVIINEDYSNTELAKITYIIRYSSVNYTTTDTFPSLEFVFNIVCSVVS